VSLKKVGLCTASLTCLLWGSLAHPFERKNWIFSQLAQVPLPTTAQSTGLQLGVSTLTYDSYSSTQGSVFWDSRLFEVGAKISGRFLGSLGVGRSSVQNQLGQWQETYSVELARRFISPEGRFGRLGLELDEFTPTGERFFQLALDTGILDSATDLGILKLSFHWFRPFKKGADTRLATSLDTGFALTQKDQRIVRLGLALGWNYQLSKEQDLAVVTISSDKQLLSEHMFFSWSPWIEYASHNFITRIALPVRLFMDKSWRAQVSPSNPAEEVLVVSYPFTWMGPDLSASLHFLF